MFQPILTKAINSFELWTCNGTNKKLNSFKKKNTIVFIHFFVISLLSFSLFFAVLSCCKSCVFIRWVKLICVIYVINLLWKHLLNTFLNDDTINGWRIEFCIGVLPLANNHILAVHKYCYQNFIFHHRIWSYSPFIYILYAPFHLKLQICQWKL